MNSSHRQRRFGVALVVACSLALSSSARAQTCDTQIASVSATGSASNGLSDSPALSGDGRFVAFESFASNLGVGNTLGQMQIYVKERATGALELASVSSSNAIGDNRSEDPRLSPDGRFVVFMSGATNFYAGDDNAEWDVYLRDRQLGITEAISVDSSGNVGNVGGSQPRVSSDGRFVVFTSYSDNFEPGDTNSLADIYLRDRLLGTTERVSLSSTGGDPNADSSAPDVSDDGRYVCYSSTASNIVAGVATGNLSLIYLRDRVLGVNRVVSMNGSGGLGFESYLPTISGDGRLVCFWSSSNGLVAGDVNQVPDIFLWRNDTGLLTIESRSSSGALSDMWSQKAILSRSGRYIAFVSAASNLVSGSLSPNPAGYLRDVATGQTSRTTLAWNGSLVLPIVHAGNNSEGCVAVSDDGTAVAFLSAAPAVANDTNGLADVFVRECTAPAASPPTVYCTAKVNSLGCMPAISFVGAPSLSAASGFTIRVDGELNNKVGLFFYGVHGRFAAPFQGGTLCVKLPLQRTMLLGTGGNLPPIKDCSGVLTFDWNAYAAGMLAAPPAEAVTFVGVQVDLQGWTRDSGFSPPNNTSLSDALEFTTLP